MHTAIIIGTVRSLIVDVAMGQIPRSTERISSSKLHCLTVSQNFPKVVQGFKRDVQCVRHELQARISRRL